MSVRVPGPARGESFSVPPFGGTLARSSPQPSGGASPLVPYYRCQADNTAVSIVRRNQAAGGSKPEGFAWFSSVLRDLDARLKGTAPQSWGMLIWGEGDGIDGTASRATPDAVLFGERYFDMPEFLKEIDYRQNILAFGLPQSKLLKRIKELREAIRNKDLQAVAEWVFEVVPELVELQQEYEEDEARQARAEQTPWADPNTPVAQTPGQQPQHFSPTNAPPAPKVEFDFKTKPNGTSPSPSPSRPIPTGRVKTLDPILPSGWTSVTHIDGKEHDANGAVHIYTDNAGARFRIRTWSDSRGNLTYQLIERMAK